MRDLLSALDNILTEKAVRATPDRFVGAKGTPFQNALKQRVGKLDNIYIDRVLPGDNLVNLRQKGGNKKTSPYYQRYTVNDPKLVARILKYLQQKNKPSVSRLGKGEFDLPDPPPSFTGGAQSTTGTFPAIPSAEIGPGFGGSQQGDNDSQSGSGVGNQQTDTTSDGSTAGPPLKMDPDPPFTGSIGQGSAGTEIGGEDPNYGKPKDPPPQSNPNPPINLQPSLTGPNPDPISPGSFSGLDQQPGSQQSSTPDSNDTNTVTDIEIGDPTDDSPSGEIPLLSPNRPGTGDVPSPEYTQQFINPLSPRPLSDPETVDQATPNTNDPLSLVPNLDEYADMYNPDTKQYKNFLVTAMLKDFGKWEDYEPLQAIYGVESSYGTNIKVGDSDRTGSYGGMQISRDNVQRYIDDLKFNVELDAALNNHPFLMYTGIMYFTEQVEKVESSLKKNKSYNADKKQNKSHVISWGFPVIDKSHFTSRNKSTGKREPVEYRVEVLKRLYPDWGDFFNQNKDKWKNQYDTKEKFAYKTKVEKTIVVPPEIDAKYVYAAITYNGGPDEVSREGKLKSNPFTYNYADKFLSLLKTQKGISEHKELIRLKTLISTDKYRNTTKEIVVENSMKTLIERVDSIILEGEYEDKMDELVAGIPKNPKPSLLRRLEKQAKEVDLGFFKVDFSGGLTQKKDFYSRVAKKLGFKVMVMPKDKPGERWKAVYAGSDKKPIDADDLPFKDKRQLLKQSIKGYFIKGKDLQKMGLKRSTIDDFYNKNSLDTKDGPLRKDPDSPYNQGLRSGDVVNQPDTELAKQTDVKKMGKGSTKTRSSSPKSGSRNTFVNQPDTELAKQTDVKKMSKGDVRTSVRYDPTTGKVIGQKFTRDPLLPYDGPTFQATGPKDAKTAQKTQRQNPKGKASFDYGVPSVKTAQKTQRQNQKGKASFDYGVPSGTKPAAPVSTSKPKISQAARDKAAAAAQTFGRRKPKSVPPPKKQLTRGIQDSIDFSQQQNKLLTEASMNVSMNGSSAAEVAELLAMIKNAGMPEPKSMAVMAPAGMSPGPIKPAGSCGCEGMEEDTVEEDHANEPDEMTMDTAYMTKDLAGGMNRPKPKGALRAKDPAIHYDDSIKENLKNSLKEMYATLNDDASAAMKQITGTPGGGAQHSQAGQFQNRKPTTVKKAQMTPLTTPGPQASPMSVKTGINPKTASLAAKAFPGYISKGGTAEQIVKFWTGKGVPKNQLQDFFRAKIRQNKDKQ